MAASLPHYPGCLCGCDPPENARILSPESDKTNLPEKTTADNFSNK